MKILHRESRLFLTNLVGTRPKNWEHFLLLLQVAHTDKSLYLLYHPETSDHMDRNDETAIDFNTSTYADNTDKKRKHPVVNDKSEEIFSTKCPACINDKPTGAYKCSECGKNVHVLAECSVSNGDREGYGEKRICTSCSNKNSVGNVISEMGHEPEPKF